MRRDLRVPCERERLPGRAGAHDEREPRRVGDPPAQLGQLDAADPGLRRRRRRHDVPCAMSREIALGPGDEVEHALVGLAGARPEREDPVLHQDHADRLRRRLAGVLARHDLGEVEPGHQVRDDDHGLAVELADARFAVRRVGDGEDRVGVRMVDELERHAAVQDRLDRRRRRGRAQHVRDELVHHVRVGEPVEARELEHVVEPDRREARRLDELEVPAAALDVEDVQLVAEAVALGDLHRRVAAAVEDERLVAAEQARGVDARAEIALESDGFRVLPETLHRSIGDVPGAPYYSGRSLRHRE